jgi:hypothetical protein
VIGIVLFLAELYCISRYINATGYLNTILQYIRSGESDNIVCVVNIYQYVTSFPADLHICFLCYKWELRATESFIHTDDIYVIRSGKRREIAFRFIL